MNKQHRKKIDAFLDEIESRSKAVLVLTLDYDGVAKIAGHGQSIDFAFMRLSLDHYLHKIMEGRAPSRGLSALPGGHIDA